MSKQIVVYSEYCVYMQRICFISCSGSTEINSITRYTTYTVKFCCLEHQYFEYFKLEAPATFSLIYFTLNNLNSPDILKVFLGGGLTKLKIARFNCILKILPVKKNCKCFMLQPNRWLLLLYIKRLSFYGICYVPFCLQFITWPLTLALWPCLCRACLLRPVNWESAIRALVWFIRS